MALRETIITSLRAIGSRKDAQFFAQIFQSQEPEKFAIIVIDPRCLKNPLFEILISDLKFLSDMNLTPVLLLGEFDADVTSIHFQSQKLCHALDKAGISNTKLNCASYEIIPSIKKITRNGRLVVLEHLPSGFAGMKHGVGKRGQQPTPLGLNDLVRLLEPFKVIFLQPSGGLRIDGQRVPVVNIDKAMDYIDVRKLSTGQSHIFETVRVLASDVCHHCTFVMASPLNLLGELFTTKGAGTLLRRGAVITRGQTYNDFDVQRLKQSIEQAFGRELLGDFFEMPVQHIFMDKDYRGGAIINEFAGMHYLSKFWVVKEAQGEGIATDIWQELFACVPKLFWRSKKDNPFNDWYMKICDGMQVSGEWRVFWKGLEALEMLNAVRAASILPVDFE
ncbi:MAG: hypothetical protein COA69_08735 [Robiginitomaculum sp.]|nr:MAG: hypothetical protein COA69_08735 [Robiginitomaculum sp.]